MKKTILLSIFACVIASNFACAAKRMSTRAHPSEEYNAWRAERHPLPQVNVVNEAPAVPADVIVAAAPGDNEPAAPQVNEYEEDVAEPHAKRQNVQQDDVSWFRSRVTDPLCKKGKAFLNLLKEHPGVACAALFTGGVALAAHYNNAIAQPVNESGAQPDVEQPVNAVTVNEVPVNASGAQQLELLLEHVNEVPVNASYAQPDVEQPVNAVTVNETGAQPKVEQSVNEAGTQPNVAAQQFKLWLEDVGKLIATNQ